MTLIKNLNHRMTRKNTTLTSREITLFLLVLVPVLLFGLSPAASAQGFVPLAPIPNLTDTQSTGGGLAVFFNNLYKYLIGLAATLAVIQIIRSGIEIAWNQDDVSKMKDDKGKIYNAIAGLALVLSPALVFSIINPQILDLSISLAPIDLSVRSATPAPTPEGLNKTSSMTGQRSNLAPANMNGAGRSNNMYTDPASIPNGQWCYTQETTFVCLPDQSGCDNMYRFAGASATGSCRQYPITN
ncbi:MAG: hypothetical protein Q7T37_01345 [bacterium]|nr:hypothetical protein [bacterium]MDO8742278.1 hypothetical protein [bacterium]